MLLWTILMTTLMGVSWQQTSGSLRRVCYYSNWSQYRPGSGKYVPENVDPSLCTHYIYAFATLQGNQIKAFEWNDESTAWSKGMYERFVALKSQNPAMKVLLAIGGWNMASGPFTQMVATPQSRQEFINSAVAFQRKNGFDGLDVDWEYPANRGSPATDRDRFTDLIKELRAAFEQEAATTGHQRLLLTAAVGAGKDKIDTAYDIPQLNRYLDFINLMTYDLHGSWESFTGHQTALYPRASETGDQRYLNVDFAARYWVQRGASPDKLNIGLATFGRTFTLTNTGQTGLGDTVRGAGNAGQETRENGFLAYYEMCRMLRNGAQTHNDQEQFVHYLTNGDQWVGGEDEQTITQKVCYVKQHGYGGVMVWAIDLDDFSGNDCGRGPYPLLHAIVNEANNPSFNNCPNPSQQQPTQAFPVLGTTHQYLNPNLIPTQGPPSGQFVVFGNTNNPGQTNAPTPYLGPYTPGQTLTPLNPAFSGVLWNTPIVGHNTAGAAVTTHPTAPPGFQTQGPQPITGNTVGNNPYMSIYSQLGFNCMNMPSDFYPNPYACDEYFICANQVTYRVRCAMGLQFNPVSKNCDWPSNVHCINRYTGVQQQTTTASYPGAWTTQPPTQTTTAHQAQISPDLFCSTMADGVYKDPLSCSDYIVCSQRRGTLGNCPQGLAYNQALRMCQDPYYVPACRALAG